MNVWIYYLIVFVNVLLMHEFGHWITAYFKGQNPKLSFFWKSPLKFGLKVKTDKPTKTSDIYDISAMGVLFGLVPLIFANVPWWFLILYFAGCSSDLKRMYKAVRGKR